MNESRTNRRKLESTAKDPTISVEAMRDGRVGMCSTVEKCYNGVPREPLLGALLKRTDNQLARSDQIPADTAGPAADAGTVPEAFTMPGKLYIDYTF